MAVGQGLLDSREQGLERQQAAEMRPLQMQAAQLGLRTGLQAEADANAQRALQAAAQQSAAIRAAEMQAAQRELVSGVLGADKLRKFSVLYPEQAKALEKTLASLETEERRQFVSEAGQARAALENGDVDFAAAYLEERAAVREEADPERAKALRNFAQTARQNPFLAQNMLGAFIAADDPSKFAEADTALQSQGAAVRERFAKAGEAEAKEEIEKVNAENRRRVIDSELGLKRAQTAKYYKDMELDAQRLGFDREKFEAENARALRELDLKFDELPTALVPSVLKLSEEAVSSGMQAQQWDSIADKFAETNAVAGVPGAVSGTLKKWVGYDDDITVLRRQYMGMKAAGVAQNLPPGSASDKDIELASAGFPSEFSSPEKLAEFSRAMARIQRADENIKAARAEFLGRNKGAGIARGSFTVSGIQVQPGQTEADVMRRVGARHRFKTAPAAPAMPVQADETEQVMVPGRGMVTMMGR
jgi:hypothetical protein